MSEMTSTYPGSCHCGALSLSYESATPPERTQVRACQCSFCRRHAARAVTDPAGSVRIVVHDESALARYRFGLGTADFLVCGRCGVFIAAVFTADDGAWATVNANALDARNRFTGDASPVDYQGEDAATRVARRRARWTPVKFVAR